MQSYKFCLPPCRSGTNAADARLCNTQASVGVFHEWHYLSGGSGCRRHVRFECIGNAMRNIEMAQATDFDAISIAPLHPVANNFDSLPYVEWSAIFAGAVVALALDFVLSTFGAAVGLSAVSPWTSTRSIASAVSYGAAFWMMLVHIWSLALGGYMAARMRHRRFGASPTEVEFRDGAHGAIVWGSAVSAGAVVAALVSASIIHASSQTDASALSVSPYTIATDTLLRTTTRQASDVRTDETRAEIGRLLSASTTRVGITGVDRAYLSQLVAARAGLSQTDAEKRVDDTVTQFKESTNRVRKIAILFGFITAATLLLGAAAAWWGGVTGGKHRDDGIVWNGLGGHYSITKLWLK